LNVSRWQAIVFDLDDTLYPERDYVLSGFRAVAEWGASRLAIPAAQGFCELRALFDQGVRGDTFNRWLASHDVAVDGLITELLCIYREHAPSLTPFPEIPQLLNDLRGRYKLGIVSDGYLGVQRRKLSGLGFGNVFDAVVFSDELGRHAWKPSVLPFEAALQRLGVAAESAVYIGDNPKKDFFGARAVGMYTIWLRRASGEYVGLEPPTARHAADYVSATVEALAELLLATSDDQTSERIAYRLYG
jgi:putative hydrolase of the HAD superfamily